MDVKENVKEGIRSIKANMLRSNLTAAIIAIGIAALVGILTAIDGLKASIDTSFSNLGANTFDIRTRYNNEERKEGKQQKVYTPLKLEEVLSFQDKFDLGLSTIHSFISFTAEVKRYSKKTNPNIAVRGVDENYMLIKEYSIKSGRNFTPFETASAVNVAMIGTEVKKALFEEDDDPVNQWINCLGYNFKIVGVLDEKGTFSGNSFADRTVFLPLSSAVRIAGDQNLDFRLTSTISDPTKTENILGEAQGLMRIIRKDPITEVENSFEIEMNKTVEEELEDISSYLRAGAFVIGFITLLGASIGLMNIMMVSVTERTREIGVRKALGATPKRIRQQFLIEALVICFMGGLGGVLLGLLIGNIVPAVIGSGNFVAPWQWISIGFIVCLTVGIISGSYPAHKASKLDPIDSLRYE